MGPSMLEDVTQLWGWTIYFRNFAMKSLNCKIYWVDTFIWRSRGRISDTGGFNISIAVSRLSFRQNFATATPQPFMTQIKHINAYQVYGGRLIINFHKTPIPSLLHKEHQYHWCDNNRYNHIPHILNLWPYIILVYAYNIILKYIYIMLKFDNNNNIKFLNLLIIYI